MTEGSYIAAYEQQTRLVEAGQAFMGALLAIQRSERGPAFEAWPQDQQQSAAATLGTQALLLAEVHGAAQVNIDMVLYGIGLAIGTQTASLTEPQMAQAIQNLIDGISVGRSEAMLARAAFQTTGSKN